MIIFDNRWPEANRHELFLSQHAVPIGFKNMGRGEAVALSMQSISQQELLQGTERFCERVPS